MASKKDHFEYEKGLVPALDLTSSSHRGITEQIAKFYPNRVFVNNLDAYHGKHIAQILCDKIFHDQSKVTDENEAMGEGEGEEEMMLEDSRRTLELTNEFPSLQRTYDIVGTLKNKFTRPSEEVVTAVLSDENDNFMEELFKCAFVIYDITNDVDEIPKAQIALHAIEKSLEEIKEKTPKKYKSIEQRIFVLISTVMTWAKTRPIDPDDPEVPFVEADYRKRKPHPNYKVHCDMEKEVIAVGKKMKDKLLTIVIATGITYGDEEEDLHFLFKLGWFNKLDLPIALPGTNIVPLLNVKDLVSLIYAIFEKPPKKSKYILAVEQTTSTQKQVVKALSKALSSERVRYVTKEEMFLFPDVNQVVYERLNVNLKMDPGCIISEFEIPWQSDFNFCENIVKIVKEFKEARYLAPINILLHGPTAVGKTTLSQKLADYYNIPFIGLTNLAQDTIKQLKSNIDYAKEMIRMKEEKIKLKLALAAEEEENIEEEEEEEDEEDYEGKIDDWKKKLIDIEKTIEMNANAINPLPNHLFLQLLKEKLRSNSCQNHGYVLNGFPDTLDQAKKLFEFDEPAPGGEEEEIVLEEEGGEEIRKFIIPHYVISLQASDEFLCNRVMHIPEKQLVELYTNEDLYLQQLLKFRNENIADKLNILDLFDEREIHPYLINAETDDIDLIFGLVKSKIGDVKLYPLTAEEEEENRLIEVEELRLKMEAEHKAREELEKQLEEERNLNMEKWADLLQSLQQEEQELISSKCENLREYLVKYIFPTLTKGLLETARVKPEDPIDFLAEFLFKENPEGRMFDPAFVASADDMFKIIEEYQERLGI